MKWIATTIADLWILKPNVIHDERGCFFESYNNKIFLEKKLSYDFVQDNHSTSRYGVLRGLHLQKNPHAQTKLVRVVKGTVLDVAVDLRKSSATYLNYFSIVLSEDNKLQLLIPRGFAHGFVVLSEEAEFLYKCDNYYNKESEDGIAYNDPTLNIDWMIPHQDIILSNKDTQYKPLEQLLTELDF